MKNQTNCESCIYYVFDDDYDCYICQVNLDEDDLVRFLSGSVMCCPHYRLNDDYQIVRKQN